MILYCSQITDPAWNLAMEEYFFEHMDHGKSYFLLWQNYNAVIIGKNQNTAAEIDGDYVRQKHIKVVRRLSGGGAVYHDEGNLNFTFITDAKDGMIDLHKFCVPVAETLCSFGVEAVIGGRNDITVDGKKFSGNAQYIRNGRVMHHGTLMFDSDLTVLQKALRVNREKIASKGIASVASRVTNLRPYLPDGVTMEVFAERLLEKLSCEEPLETCILSEEDIRAIDIIKADRYDTWQWNYGKSPECTFRNNARIEGCGWISVQLRADGGYIRELYISGDFFGNRDVSRLAELLKDCAFSRDAVLERLREIPVEEYIHNLTAEALAALLTP